MENLPITLGGILFVCTLLAALGGVIKLYRDFRKETLAQAKVQSDNESSHAILIKEMAASKDRDEKQNDEFKEFRSRTYQALDDIKHRLTRVETKVEGQCDRLKRVEHRIFNGS